MQSCLENCEESAKNDHNFHDDDNNDDDDEDLKLTCKENDPTYSRQIFHGRFSHRCLPRC